MNESISDVFLRHIHRWNLPKSWKEQLMTLVSTSGFETKIQFWSGLADNNLVDCRWLEKVLNQIDFSNTDACYGTKEKRLFLVRNFSGSTFAECTAEADIYINSTLRRGVVDILYPNWGDTVYDLLQRIFAMVDFNGSMPNKLPRSNRWPMRGLATDRVKKFCLGLSKLDCNVLISGPSGIGKEAIARYIHSATACSGEFVSVSIPAIPNELFAGVLFGYEKGSYTGAYHDQSGSFELAKNGTLFLDEVADMEPRQQAALLRVLSERRGCSIGATRTYPITCRIIAATNRYEVMRKSFRPDLRIRLAEEEISAAEGLADWQPLRKLSLIRDHIPLLFAMQYVRCYHEQIGFNQNVGKISISVMGQEDSVGETAYRCLADYPWTMNYRELNQIALHALLRSLVDMRPVKEEWRIVLKLRSRFDQVDVDVGDLLDIPCPHGVKMWDFLADTARYRAISKLSSVEKTERVAEILGVDRSSVTRFLSGYKRRYIQTSD